ncbi:MAG: serine/threonine protein phosphatase [Pirellulales bacterium]|nr:serine/threonine protein phosphatase [Pirellulales bacterium]
MANSDRLIALGDVHGCIHALDAVLEAIAPQPQDTLVFLGDLIDQGRDSRSVLERVIDLKQQCRVVLIEGNHEEMLLAARDSEEALRYWERCGGVNTLNSYRFCGTLADIPDSHWELLAGARPYWETDDFIFTHANYLADVPMGLQPDYQLRWALFEPAEARPHFSGKPVIVGHTEQPDSEVLDLGYATCLDTACWRYGWLTALDVHSRELWQASRWGILRELGEAPHRGRLPQLAMAVA